jgi:hypothetical protein
MSFRKGFLLTAVLAALLAIGVTLFWILFVKERPQPQQAPIKIQAEQLMYEYVPNIPAGDAKYKGKELFVKGKIVKAEPDEGIVRLKGIDAEITNVVVCHFQDSETRETISNAFENQEIIVHGVNTGWDRQGVHLRPCRIRFDVR